MQNSHYLLRFIIITGILSGMFFTSCKKETFYEKDDASLEISKTTITFDTIFTTIGTVTQKFTVFNPHKGTVKTDIVLVGGNASFFSVNVDGVPGTVFKDVEIPAKDSIFIFVKVNIHPNGGNTPMLIVDTLAFYTNGNRQNVDLLACGEDAIFIVADKVFNGSLPYKIVAEEGQTVRWKKDKPYVIYGYATIDENAKLIIEAGTQIYLHKGAGLWVSPDGCLHVDGTKEEPVVFQGDRRAFANQADYAQWDKIWINEGSQDNIINYAIIKNAFIGIHTETRDYGMGNKLILSNSIIKHSELAGLLSWNYKIDAFNNVIYDCRQHCAILQIGLYDFRNNTIYNKTTGKRENPSVFVSDYYNISTTVQYTGTVKADFSNNIIYGNIAKELRFGYDNAANFDLKLNNCLIKMHDSLFYTLPSCSNVILNTDPLVNNESEHDFSLKDNSPCKGKGIFFGAITTDITGATRNNPPSIGAYE